MKCVPHGNYFVNKKSMPFQIKISILPNKSLVKILDFRCTFDALRSILVNLRCLILKLLWGPCPYPPPPPSLEELGTNTKKLQMPSSDREIPPDPIDAPVRRISRIICQGSGYFYAIKITCVAKSIPQWLGL